MPTKRGGFLTAMPILLAFAGSVDVLKALRSRRRLGKKMMGMDAPATGIMFLGVLHTGPSATILGVLLGATLFSMQIGIWRMKRYAMTLPGSTPPYVILNVTLFTIRISAADAGAMIFAVRVFGRRDRIYGSAPQERSRAADQT